MNTNSNNTNNMNATNRINVHAKTSILELRDEMSRDGLKLTYVMYDDIKIGMLGYLNDKDRAAAEKLLKKIGEGVNGPIELMARLSVLTTLEDSGIAPDEEVEVNGEQCYISYTDRSLYRAADCTKICDLHDLKCELPNEAIKTLLLERASR